MTLAWVHCSAASAINWAMEGPVAVAMKKATMWAMKWATVMKMIVEMSHQGVFCGSHHGNHRPGAMKETMEKATPVTTTGQTLEEVIEEGMAMDTG